MWYILKKLYYEELDGFKKKITLVKYSYFTGETTKLYYFMFSFLF